MDFHLARAVARIESASNPYALRFEPHILARYNARTSLAPEVRAAKVANKCSDATAEIICATSWGVYQIMGFNLYRGLINFPVIEFCNRADRQFDAFAEFVKKAGQGAATGADLLADKGKRDAFAKAYNGPGNVPDYSTKLLAALRATA